VAIPLSIRAEIEAEIQGGYSLLFLTTCDPGAMWHFEALLGVGNLRNRERCIDLENIVGGVAFDNNILFIHRGRQTVGHTEIHGKFTA
jgi:hypothetical protein